MYVVLLIFVILLLVWLAWPRGWKKSFANVITWRLSRILCDVFTEYAFMSSFVSLNGSFVSLCMLHATSNAYCNPFPAAIELNRSTLKCAEVINPQSYCKVSLWHFATRCCVDLQGCVDLRPDKDAPRSVCESFIRIGAIWGPASFGVKGKSECGARHHGPPFLWISQCCSSHITFYFL